jgi:hypothetical protein
MQSYARSGIRGVEIGMFKIRDIALFKDYSRSGPSFLGTQDRREYIGDMYHWQCNLPARQIPRETKFHCLSLIKCIQSRQGLYKENNDLAVMGRGGGGG